MADTDPTPGATIPSLLRASADIHASLDLAETLETIARRALAILQARASAVILLDAPRRRLVLAAVADDPREPLLGQEFDAEGGLAGLVMQTGKSVLIRDLVSQRSALGGVDQPLTTETGSLMVVPLACGGRVLGVVEVISREQAPDWMAADLEVGAALGTLAAGAIRNARSHGRLQIENYSLRRALPAGPRLIGVSAAMRQLGEQIQRVADTTTPILLTGEVGAGKRLAALAIHDASARRERPCVRVNCATEPQEAQARELFGGLADEGADQDTDLPGGFELAEGGTILLEEVGQLGPAVQLRLLRTMEERHFIHAQGDTLIPCDARIIASSRRNLADEVEAGRFRRDLYDRLSVFPLHIPALRDRPEDLPLLAEHFLGQLAAELRISRPTLTRPAMATLATYGFPGNMRELHNLLERACLLAHGGTIGLEHLPRELVSGAPSPADPPSGSAGTLWGYEKALIVQSLTAHRWNQSRAARSLGISRDNLRYRMKKYNIHRPG